MNYYTQYLIHKGHVMEALAIHETLLTQPHLLNEAYFNMWLSKLAKLNHYETTMKLWHTCLSLKIKLSDQTVSLLWIQSFLLRMQCHHLMVHSLQKYMCRFLRRSRLGVRTGPVWRR